MSGHTMVAFDVAPGGITKGNLASVVHCFTIRTFLLKTIETLCRIGHTLNRSKSEMRKAEALPSPFVYHLSLEIGRDGKSRNTELKVRHVGNHMPVLFCGPAPVRLNIRGAGPLFM
jgi:hypothetical protein